MKHRYYVVHQAEYTSTPPHGIIGPPGTYFKTTTLQLDYREPIYDVIELSENMLDELRKDEPMLTSILILNIIPLPI